MMEYCDDFVKYGKYCDKYSSTVKIPTVPFVIITLIALVFYLICIKNGWYLYM